MSRERDYLQEDLIIIMITIDKKRTLDSDQGPGDPTQE